MPSLSSTSDESEQVLVEDKLIVRKVVLNRPRLLNALSYFMVSRLLELFLAYEEDPDAKLIILKGTGRAFCAGGDVAAVVRDTTRGNWRLSAEFFGKEFILNYVIATCRKIQVSILNGIVMGGGAGVSIHGRFRVATENTVFAMPETALGLFPDIGASYFLSRLPGFFGEYVGLTGARLDGAEMLACGLATHFVNSKKLPMLEEAICEADVTDLVNISAIIEKFVDHPQVKETSAYFRETNMISVMSVPRRWNGCFSGFLPKQLDIIDRCFSHETVEEIVSALEKEDVNRNYDWITAAIQSLKKASPTSLKISLRSIREGRLEGVGRCLVREYRMVSHVLRGEISRDFFEGCRAILLDKDKNPKWEPSRLDLVDNSMVDRFFSRVDDEDWEDLQLPARSSLPSFAMAKL